MADHRANDPEDSPTEPKVRRRRVVTPPPSGSDPNPAPEPPRHASTENDDRLKRDKPPHWA